MHSGIDFKARAAAFDFEMSWLSQGLNRMSLTAQNVATLFQAALVVWLVALAAVVFYNVLLCGRALTQMLCDESGRFAPERVGTFFIILVVAGYYVLSAGSADLILDEATGTYWMPDIPQSLLILLAGGKSVYLAGKIARPNNRRPR